MEASQSSEASFSHRSRYRGNRLSAVLLLKECRHAEIGKLIAASIIPAYEKWQSSESLNQQPLRASQLAAPPLQAKRLPHPRLSV